MPNSHLTEMQRATVADAKISGAVTHGTHTIRSRVGAKRRGG